MTQTRQIQFPVELADRLETEAKLLGISVSEYILLLEKSRFGWCDQASHGTAQVSKAGCIDTKQNPQP